MTSTKINVTIDFPALVDVAVEDAMGRLAVRTPSGLASFFPVGDGLEARVSPAMADYFAGIEGFQVEGRDAVVRKGPEVADWNKHGEMLKKQREQIEIAQPAAPQQDLLGTLLTLLGGPEAVKALLAGGIQQQAPAIVAKVDADEQAAIDEAARVQAERDAAQGYTFFKLQGKIDDEDVVLLLGEFDPEYNADAAHPKARLSHLAKQANANHVLGGRLQKMLK